LPRTPAAPATSEAQGGSAGDVPKCAIGSNAALITTAVQVKSPSDDRRLEAEIEPKTPPQLVSGVIGLPAVPPRNVMTVVTSIRENADNAAASFSASFEPDGYVVLKGELDVTGIAALRDALDQAILATRESIVITATALKFIDSAAITEILRYNLIACIQDRDLLLDGVSDQVAVVLDAFDLCPILMKSVDWFPYGDPAA